MLIGSLIGLAIGTAIFGAFYLNLCAKAHRHNTALDGALAHIQGRVKVTVHPVGAMLFLGFPTLLGAIIGYFI